MKSLSKLLHHHRFRILILLFVFLALDVGVLIVPVERSHPEALITNVEEGVWWAVTTMTGVGYGDFYPVTRLGRAMGMVLEVLGVVVFALIAGQVAVALFRVQDDFYWKRVFVRLDRLEEKLDKLEKKQDFLVKTNGDGTE